MLTNKEVIMEKVYKISIYRKVFGFYTYVIYESFTIHYQLANLMFRLHKDFCI